LLSKSGAEGQSRTDTGSPPRVFECGAMPGHKLALFVINAMLRLKPAYMWS